MLHSEVTKQKFQVAAHNPDGLSNMQQAQENSSLTLQHFSHFYDNNNICSMNICLNVCPPPSPTGQHLTPKPREREPDTGLRDPANVPMLFTSCVHHP